MPSDSSRKPQRLETLAIHAGGEPDAETGAIAPPLHFSTTFVHGPGGERIGAFEYQRESHPTAARLESALAALEGGAACLSFASGMAAMNALLASLPRGSEVIIPADCYGGLRALGAEILDRDSVVVVTVDTTDVEAVARAITGRTRCIWLETPSNPLVQVSDIAAIATLAHAHDAIVACDATFASPVLEQPLLLGADVSMHSTTKFIGGHHDALGGALVFARRDALFDAVARRRLLSGTVLAPFSAWLTLRGVRSLAARMAFHCANARAIASWLAKHPRVARVHYPGLPDDPGHALASRQMRDYGGMLSFRMRTSEEAIAVASRVRLILNATSLGGCETTIEHRVSIEFPPVSPPELLRLSVGLEHADDLIADLEQALAL